ncbi:serpin family protein [Kallotenue papyrolyticum]|uniref:serpin family protein n=1 Tax=Kallotenue papyrolyticum TaxID=1325125 RepID=UPI0004785CD5|nr:serpin family protein [Kallotenue papyrolyticum]
MDTQLVRAEVARANPAPAGADLATLVDGATAFAFDLYRRAVDGNTDNLIFSPYSIALAFSLPYAGARGETEQQMATTLRFLPQDRHHAAFNALDQRLQALSEQVDPDGVQGDAFQLTLANAVWGQQGFPFEKTYLDTLARFYGAGLSTLDMANQPQQATETINRWVAEQTAARITDLLPPGVIGPNTRLVLVNAVAFKASWLFPFNESMTRDGVFTRLDGSTVTTPLMHGVQRVFYAESESWQAVSLPYVGRKVEMLVILPRAGRFAAVESSLSGDMLADLRNQLEERDVTLTLPRWEFDAALDLKELLMELGMSAPFEHADFSGISPRPLWIDAALHRGAITVDEEGTEAAAATAIVMAERALPPATFQADRPLIYAILERDTGALLFLGRVTDPSR